MEIKSPELLNAAEVAPNSTTPVKGKVTIEQVRDLLCEYVSQSNYNMVKHIERGFVYARDTRDTEELLQFIMQSIRAQLIGQMDPQSIKYSDNATTISHVFDSIKHMLQLIPADTNSQAKSQMAAFIVGNLLKFIT
jgi:hypothetical protein